MMNLTISQKYLETLKSSQDWLTVSDWAIRVGTMFPEILESANKDAEGQKNETTGLREIAARISSNISRGAYVGQIEINDTERPRLVKYVSEDEAHKLEEKEIEDDLEPLTREQKIRQDETVLSVKDKYRLGEFETIISQLREFFYLDFEFEHSKALLNPTDPGKHHPDNIQILLKSHNRLKGKKNWERFTLDEQIDYIRSNVKVQKIISKKMNIEIDDEVIEQDYRRD